MDVQSSATLTTVLAIFLLMMAGYAAKKVGFLKADDVSVVNSLLINLTMPAFIFVNTHKKPFIPDMLKAPFIGILAEMSIMGIAYFVARALKLDRRTTGAFMLVSVFGNTGFLGYPVISAAFQNNKHAILTAVMIDQFAMAFVLITVGITVATTFSGQAFEWKNIIDFFKTPLLPFTIIALALRNVPLPELILQTLDYMGKGTVPLAMISIGLSLSAGSIKKYPVPLAAAILLKMCLLPLMMYFYMRYFGVRGIVFEVAVLEMAMPSAVFTGVVSARFGANGAFAAAAIFLMTLLSVVVIPGVFLLIA